MWKPIEDVPSRQIVLVCNPVEGFVPVVAKKIGDQWFNVGAVPVGRSSGDYKLEPTPTHWMPIPEMPAS